MTRAHHLRYMFALALVVMIAACYGAPQIAATFAPINTALTQVHR